MYKLDLTDSEYELFKKRVRCEMIMRDLQISDLAEMTKYSEMTIRNFLSVRKSKFVAYALCKALGLEGEFI